MTSLYGRRMFVNRFNLVMSMGTMVFGMVFLFWILATLFIRGFEALSPTLFTQMTPPPGQSGGLANAIFGSFVIVFVATFISTPIGILAGIYLAEFGKNGWIARSTRFINDILLSAPSIVIGLFIYTVFVAKFEHFSGWAGSFALALIAIPVVVRTTENMLRLVPSSLREASLALGIPQWKTSLRIVLRTALGGIVTAVLLAVARAAGETAPLLFTSLNNQYWNLQPDQPTSSLTVQIFNYAISPYEDWHAKAWSAALVLLVLVGGLNVLARVATANRAAR